jgi:hypothetical protein
VPKNSANTCQQQDARISVRACRQEGFSCPLCHGPLTKERWLEVTGLWQEREQLLLEAKKREIKAQRLGAEKERRRTAYLQSLLRKRDDDLGRLQQQNRDLREQLKRGTTPQMEGLLYEPELCRELKDRFPSDKITHRGKGGDVVQQVVLNGKKVGTLVFECKRVQRMAKKHVEQARYAKVEREADYSVLVTTASKVNTFGFWTEKDVLVVHPAGVAALVGCLRESLLKLAQLRMTGTQRERAAKAVLEFVGSPEFRNPLRDVVRRGEQLGQDLAMEVATHKRLWRDRLTHYQAIWTEGHSLERDFDRILEQYSPHPEGRVRLPKGHDEEPAYPVRNEGLLFPGKMRQ